MNDFGLFSERSAASAARKLKEITRFAARREELVDPIDLDSLPRSAAFDILETDDQLAKTIGFGPIYVDHLKALEAQRAEIAATLSHAT